MAGRAAPTFSWRQRRVKDDRSHWTPIQSRSRCHSLKDRGGQRGRKEKSAGGRWPLLFWPLKRDESRLGSITSCVVRSGRQGDPGRFVVYLVGSRTILIAYLRVGKTA